MHYLNISKVLYHLWWSPSNCQRPSGQISGDEPSTEVRYIDCFPSTASIHGCGWKNEKRRVYDDSEKVM